MPPSDDRASPPPPPPENKAALCGYIAEMCAELTRMASAARLDLLAYLLDMAREEADRTKSRRS